jgi:hypothetical protein
MARINSNRFESLPVEEDQEETPAKKTTHQVTPEFPAVANAPAEAASIGQPALPVAHDVIVSQLELIGLPTQPMRLGEEVK